jgi:membrane fusion protein, multidrug efflux system
MLDRTSNGKAGQDQNDDRHGDNRGAQDHDILDVRTSRRETESPSQDRDEHSEPDKDGSDQSDQKDDGSEPNSADRKSGVWATLRRHKIAVAIAILIVIIVIAAAIIWYMHARNFESTDDAFIDGRPVVISPEVTGNIVRVAVTDNQLVHAGELLAEIDPRNYQAAVHQADAQITQAQASIATSRAQIGAQQTQASLLAYIDVFFTLMLVAIAVTVLALTLRKSKSGGAQAAA